MIEQIKGLEIEGRKFLPKKPLNFFEPTSQGAKPQQLALVYGRNGTGKTTLATAFRQVDPLWKDESLSVSLIRDDGSLISLPDVNNKILPTSIRVFDEKYVDKKIKLVPTADGLGTIVLISDPGSSQKDLDAAEAQKTKAQGHEKTLEKLIEDFDDQNKVGSKRQIFETIRGVLKNGWATEDQQIRGLTRKTNVDDELVNEIGQMHCQTKKEDIIALKAKIGKQLKELEDVGDPTAIPEVKQVVVAGFNEASLVALINKRIEKPELTDREKKILAVYESNAKQIESARLTFSSDAEFCPYCFRPIDSEARKSLLASILKILNKEVDDYKNELANITFPIISFDKNVYRTIDKDLAKEVEVAVDSAKSILEDYQADVAAKQGNVFQSVTYAIRGLATAVDVVNAKLSELEQKRQELIVRANQKKTLVKELARITREQAHYLIAPMYLTYLNQANVQARKTRLLARIRKIIARHETKINSIKARMQGTDLAVKCINESLSYIYSSPTRFEIAVKDNKYVLKSNGFDIKPCDVSTGERHALALAYFFVDIMENHELTKFYQDEMLVVIDDPVSSFDSENRIGVYSLLMRKYASILTGNANSRVITMTHDAFTMLQLERMFQTLVKEILPQPKTKVGLWTLTIEGMLQPFNPSRFNEYSSLLWDIYSYAKTGTSGTSAFSVGNEIRRVLEAYSTFLYRKDFQDLFYDKSSQAKLNEFAEFFKSRMARTVLNGESHLKYQTQSFSSDACYFAIVSEPERQDVAREVLCLLHLLDREHLEPHLVPPPEFKSETTPIQDIEVWLEDIRKTLQAKVAAV